MAANESNIDIQQMQREAIQRAREMQRRAQDGERPETHPPQSGGQRSRQNTQTVAAPVRQQSVPAPALSLPERETHKNPASFSAGEIIESLLQDGERTLILILILLLSSEKCDSSLIFALLYLAM